MASLTVAQVESDVAQLAVALLTQNEVAVVASLNAGEAAIMTGLANLIKNLPVPKGIFGSFEGDILSGLESEFETYLASLAGKYGGQAVFNLIIELLQKL